MSYFHTGIRTIIGAESFHGPVRDGKEWYQLAMVLRHNFLSPCAAVKQTQSNQFIELISFIDFSTSSFISRILNASNWHNFLDQLIHYF